MPEEKVHISIKEANSSNAPGLLSMYKETLQRIKETDNISFKLLSFVPLVSGASIVGLIVNAKVLPLLILLVIGWLGALITYCIFRWELRNIQTCERLRELAKALEKVLKMPYDKMENKEVVNLKLKPTLKKKVFNKNGWGKTEAEKHLYWTVIIFWMLFPILAWVYKLSSGLPYSAYFMKVPIITLGIHTLAAVFFWTVQIYGFGSSNSEESYNKDEQQGKTTHPPKEV